MKNTANATQKINLSKAIIDLFDASTGRIYSVLAEEEYQQYGEIFVGVYRVENEGHVWIPVNTSGQSTDQDDWAGLFGWVEEEFVELNWL